jgi:hypothetical protein
MLTTSSQGPQTITLRCRDEFSAGNPVEVRNVRILAVSVGGIVAASAAGKTGSTPADPASRPAQATR